MRILLSSNGFGSFWSIPVVVVFADRGTMRPPPLVARRVMDDDEAAVSISMLYDVPVEGLDMTVENCLVHEVHSGSTSDAAD